MEVHFLRHENNSNGPLRREGFQIFSIIVIKRNHLYRKCLFKLEDDYNLLLACTSTGSSIPRVAVVTDARVGSICIVTCRTAVTLVT